MDENKQISENRFKQNMITIKLDFFMHNNQLSSHIGFVENRAVFFNGSKIWHSDLQSFGDSSNRYTLNIFYKDEN